MDGDAEWVGVDFEFGRPGNAGPTTTSRPRPRPRPSVPRLPPVGPATEPPHDANDVAPATPTGGFNAAALAGAVGGVLGVVLLLLVVYMFVLRRKLSKAKVARGDSEYRLRVEDVAHLTHLDETSNTYVNTTDLQKLVSSVRAKKKAEEKLPLPPRLQPQAPPLVRQPTSPPAGDRSSASSAGQADNDAFRGDVDVVTLRPPMPLPHPKPDILQGVLPPRTGALSPEPVSEIIYSNLHQPSQPTPQPTPQSPVAKAARIEPPKIAPPPPPAKKPKREAAVTVSPAVVAVGGPEETDAPVSPTVIARPAPPPPVARPAPPAGSPPTNTKDRSAVQKPTPPVAPKPQKAASSDAPTPTKTPPPKPALPKAAKPGVLSKGRGLPPLKMALLHSDSRSSIDSCATPDTSVLELTPDADEGRSTASISAKIAFLEGKMKSPATAPRGMPAKT